MPQMPCSRLVPCEILAPEGVPISADGETIIFGYSHTLSDLCIAERLR